LLQVGKNTRKKMNTTRDHIRERSVKKRREQVLLPVDHHHHRLPSFRFAVNIRRLFAADDELDQAKGLLLSPVFAPN